MPATRRQKVSLPEGKKVLRRDRVKFIAARSTGAKRVSVLQGKKSPRRRRRTFLAKSAPFAGTG